MNDAGVEESGLSYSVSQVYQRFKNLGNAALRIHSTKTFQNQLYTVWHYWITGSSNFCEKGSRSPKKSYRKNFLHKKFTPLSKLYTNVGF